MILILTATIVPHEETLTSIVMILLNNTWSILDILYVADCTDIDKKGELTARWHGFFCQCASEAKKIGEDSSC